MKEIEIFGNQEAAFPLDPGARFVETRSGFWNHDHCLIGDVAIGRDAPSGYRESSFARGPNSVGIWLCELCFDRYVKWDDFSFLVRSTTFDAKKVIDMVRRTREPQATRGVPRAKRRINNKKRSVRPRLVVRWTTRASEASHQLLAQENA